MARGHKYTQQQLSERMYTKPIADAASVQQNIATMAVHEGLHTNWYLNTIGQLLIATHSTGGSSQRDCA